MGGRRLERTILIDNNLMSMRASPTNCILIDNFYGDANDQQLEEMWNILTELNAFSDVRPCLAESFLIKEKINALLAKPGTIKEPIGRNGRYLYSEIAPIDRLLAKLDVIKEETEPKESNLDTQITTSDQSETQL